MSSTQLNRSPLEPPLTGIASRHSNSATSISDGGIQSAQGSYSSNTGGRSQKSWRNSVSTGVVSLLRKSNTTINDELSRTGPMSVATRRFPVGKANSNPTEPTQVTSVLPVKLLAPSVHPPTRPDELRSFLDLVSDDSEDSEVDHGEAILSRASSVQVRRAQLVQSAPVDHSVSEAVVQVRHGAPVSPLLTRIVGRRNLQRPSSQDEDAELTLPYPPPPIGSIAVNEESSAGVGPEDVSRKLTANISYFPVKAIAKREIIPGGSKEALRMLSGRGADFAPTNALAARPKSTEDLIRLSIIETPPNQIQVDALSTLQSPLGGFGSLHIPPEQERNTTSSLGNAHINGLRANPTNSAEACLHHTISAPPLLNQNTNRKVKIRPSDLIISDLDGQRQKFRDHVVSTPYPTEHNSMVNHEECLTNAFATSTAHRGLPSTQEVKVDRFPSPNRAGVFVLVLQIAAARRPSLQTTITIDISDKGTFDDSQLFTAIKRSYARSLLDPIHCVFSARKISHATFSNDSSFDSEGFINHFKNPKTGHKRRGWLLWLQNHQAIVLDSGGDKSSSCHSPSSVPRMPFQRKQPLPPKVVLHFELSLMSIASAVSVTLIVSCLSSTLWVLFGVPRSDAGRQARSTETVSRRWDQDTEGRVLTGLVLGVLVSLLGSIGCASWVGGSWILL